MKLNLAGYFCLPAVVSTHVRKKKRQAKTETSKSIDIWNKTNNKKESNVNLNNWCNRKLLNS